jgi:indole-3-glycerol phosphate synthase
VPPEGVLGRLCLEARRRADDLQAQAATIRSAAERAVTPPSLASALRAGDEVAIIAELKRQSPSKGVLITRLDAVATARAYVEGGARALSVLTEPDAFGGSNADVTEVRGAVAVPVLRKDFHVDPLQVWEARAIGASAVLLIVRALGPDGTPSLAAAARDAGMEALFEIRQESELEWALDAGADLIGVNRRNLETLEMAGEVLERLLPIIPFGCVAVAESGIHHREDVVAASRLGADAVLVGSALSLGGGASRMVASLAGVPRGERRG